MILSILINQLIRTGISYPKARELALIEFLGSHSKYKQILNHRNNILGIEYLKAIKKYKSTIKPITIKRRVHILRLISTSLLATL